MKSQYSVPRKILVPRFKANRVLRRVGRGDGAEAGLVFPEILGQRSDQALHMARTHDDTGVERPSRRKHIQEIEHKLLFGMHHLHQVCVLPLHLLIRRLDLDLILLL